MKWLAKAGLQKVFSGLPRGQRLNYLFQRYVTHGLPRPAEFMVEYFGNAVQYLHAASLWGDLPQGPRRAYEFGAGQDLANALSLYALGVDRQVLVDLRPLAQWNLLAQTMEDLRARWTRLRALAGRELRPWPAQAPASMIQLERALGISYHAPADARATGLETGSFDLVSSNHVLEHIPADDLPAILAECRRLVSPRGVVCHLWNMQDHYAEFDRSISVYNFLTLDEVRWGLVNSSLHYQNRLRLPDYLGMFKDAGLRLVHRQVWWPSPEDLELLAHLPLAAKFAGRYTPRELGAHMALAVFKAD
ncbi:MAG: methyltransferase domain-containing protein [Desulfarculaceae bacterium]|nr:methyltransferase domain-containing protein [Desulfarculaceae bacterium]MCF8045994.1 methyltransferase domain-containing protein [Desulfarculaceae bacterium]MCF8066405.1 methyltransferase domain-containing protein [Desulfarculaceae bacterium]MCF8097657.1 methyltransferase domain-containing protein [Desulfarculaceae bacterium]MCF8122472.1 methyltransferase domain-containing protein [Desulfarculaceae bacterium]